MQREARKKTSVWSDRITGAESCREILMYLRMCWNPWQELGLSKIKTLPNIEDHRVGSQSIFAEPNWIAFNVFEYLVHV